MPTDNSTLLAQARASLSDRWGMAIATYLLFILITGTIALPKAGLISLLITGPMLLGATTVALRYARDQEVGLEQLFDGFKHFGTAILTYVIMVVFIFLWTLLLIVPGIIASLSYSMSFYILADDKSLKAMEVLDASKQMMEGHKMKLFYLYLRFLLLALLCILTLGIGFLWLVPYMYVTMAKFYDDIRILDKKEPQLYQESHIV